MTRAADEPQRIQKLLAHAGVGSRRACEQAIAAGRVTVDGRVASLGDRAADGDVVAFDGIVVSWRPGLEHYLLNKPRGVLSAASDARGRMCVTDLVDASSRVYPVGRLDADSEGLIIVTNDGDLAYRLTHPSFGVPKEYLAELDRVPTERTLRTLRRGVELSDGVTAAASVTLLGASGRDRPRRARDRPRPPDRRPDRLPDRGPDRVVVRFVISEGRNRQIRRMCDTVGHRVLRLVRTRIGPLTDPALAPGRHRALDPAEVHALQRAASRSSAAEPGVGKPGVGEPGVGEPGVGEPGVGKPGVGKPGVGKPGVGKP